ncbi:MAG: hypothetical protein Q4B26_16990 [Eubacteriales bacterium]|nr:hypothetical protein [Eubacteriales bacterium]
MKNKKIFYILIMIILFMGMFSYVSYSRKENEKKSRMLTSDTWVLRNESYDRFEIRTITFLDETKGAPVDAWDVSKEKNGNVIAWVE